MGEFMSVDVEKYKTIGPAEARRTPKISRKSRERAPKNLDRIVQDIHAEVFSEIDCTECANCCKTLGPLFTEADTTSHCQTSSYETACFRRDVFAE